MKQILSLLAAILLVTISSSAQRTVLGDRFQLNSFGSYLGMNMDFHRDMSIGWMRSHTADPSVIEIDELTPNVQNYAEVTGAVLGTSFGFSPKSKKSSGYNLDQELIVSANIIIDREALVSYDNYEPSAQAVIRNSKMFCLMDNEVNLEMQYQFTHNWSIFKFNAGAGASVGSTFGCQMLVIKNQYMDYGSDNWENIDPEQLRKADVSSTEIYDGVCSTFLRGFATAGAGFLIGGHIELGAQMRFGAGKESMPGTDFNSTIITGAFLTQVRYHIPKLNRKGPVDVQYFD
jgi:hypothetical protein